ncbi:MAG: methyltransferase domain-containing protein [Planctomycetota bacterium]
MGLMQRAALFEWVNGAVRYRGLPVEQHRIRIADDTFEIAALKDAAALLDDAEVVRECEKTDRLPYGFELWPAALMLAEYLYRGEPGRGRRAIELGCGVGLVSIAAARRGWRVLTTDCDPVPLQFAEFNAAANTVPSRLRTRDVEAYQLLDWHNPPSGPRFARVLAADVLYQRCDHTPILNCIEALLEQDGMAIIADPNRGVADDFASQADASGFDVELIQAAASLDPRKPVAGRLFLLRQRKTQKLRNGESRNGAV